MVVPIVNLGDEEEKVSVGAWFFNQLLRFLGGFESISYTEYVEELPRAAGNKVGNRISLGARRAVNSRISYVI